MAGQSIRISENIAKLTKASGTTLTLAASRVNIGALQYVTPSLTLNTAIVGIGGVDATVAASSLYYVYAVVSSGTAYLIASLSATAPTGYAQCRRLGVFVTDAAGALYGLVNRDTAVTGYTKQSKWIDIASYVSLSGATTPSGRTISSCTAKAQFYADSAGVWRMSANISVSLSSTVTNVAFAIAGVTFKAALNQAIEQIAVDGRAYVYGVGNNIQVDTTTAASSPVLSIDVELNAEPTTYTIATNMETPIYS